MSQIDLAQEEGGASLLVAALYRFTRFEYPYSVRGTVQTWCAELGTRGTLLLAGEGINGTVSGEPAAVTELVSRLRSLPGCSDLDVKYSQAADHPFARMKVKVKREIVTMGVEGLDPAREAGTHLESTEWNALIADPDTILIDTRNEYEVAIGSFEGAINPVLRNFREFPGWFAEMGAQLRQSGEKPPRIAMFCTGGIRCEKSTAYARRLGFEEVYHLKGGILKYLEDVPEADSRWRGNCFVFDGRVSLDHRLDAAGDCMCRTCGHPFQEDQQHICAVASGG